MIKSRLTPALNAALCLIALDVLKRVGLATDVSKQATVAKLGVARSHVYELVPKVEAALERGLQPPPADDSSAMAAELRFLKAKNAVLEYRLSHPGCWVSGGRTVYAADLVAFIIDLAAQSIGPHMTQSDFADACQIPLPTLKDWRAHAACQLTLPLDTPAPEPEVPQSLPETQESAPEAPQSLPETQEESAPEAPEPASPPAPTPQQQDQAPAADDSGLSLSADMLVIVAEYERWQGSMPAFVDHLRGLGLRYGRQMVTQILHLCAARKILRRQPPKPAARGSTFRPPPGVQWVSDGKKLDVVVDDQKIRLCWQPSADVGSTASVGSVVRVEEDTEGVRSSVADGIETTGQAATFLLLDNKACNTSPDLAQKLAPGTTVMHSTLGRGQNKAVIEGQFGLFSQDLGPVIATVDTSSPQSIALTVADAVTRAYATGRNHRPRRRDGRTPYELYRDANPSPAQLRAATERLHAIKERTDARNAREQARLDPAVQATIEQACQRFAFADDGDMPISLRTLSLEAIQSAIALYAAKQQAQSLSPDAAGIRYFAGIARNCQYERELLFFEQELACQLERTGAIVTEHLERKAASFASRDPSANLHAIVGELLAVTAPLAQVFWRGRFEAQAARLHQDLRPALRRSLCERIRRRFSATKRHRQQLIDLVVPALAPGPTSPPPAACPVDYPQPAT
jgi:hypothetical protein